MNLGDLIISPFTTVLVLLYKAVQALPGLAPGLHTALTIASFAVLIWLIAIPFFRQRQKSAAKMQELQHQLAILNQRYANDREKLAQAQVRLYSEAGVNPLSGCLPMLIQGVFVFGIYSAITAALGETPYQPLNLHGRVLIPSLVGEIPLPNQCLGLDLAQPNLIFAVLVVVTTFVQQRLPSLIGSERTTPAGWFRVYGIPLTLGLVASRLVSGLSIFVIVFNLDNIVQHAMMQSVTLRNLFLGREKTRRWQLRRALGQRALTLRQFEKLASSLLQPPELTPEDIPLAYKLLELGAHNFNESWPVDLAEKAGKALSRLGSFREDIEYDLTSLYHKFAEGCAKSGYKEMSADLAAAGYACSQGSVASRTACILLLARGEQIDERARGIYETFLTDHSQDSLAVQSFVDIFQDKGEITPDMDAMQVKQRMPFDVCIAELLPDKPHSWAKRNLGLAHLILNSVELASRYFQDVLASNPLDSIAAQGLAIALFRMGQYDSSLRVVQDARQAGSSENALEAIGTLCQVARWLDAVKVEAGVGFNQLQAWNSQLQVTLALRRFLVPEIDFIQGRLAATTGDWGKARKHLQAAHKADKNSVRFAYYYAQLLQISGEWEVAAQVLKDKKTGPPELTCLSLKQARHDIGLDQLGRELVQFTNDLDARTLGERLAAAKYALLAGRSADISPWPASLTFENSAQADEWAEIWLFALVGRADAKNARMETKNAHFLRLPKPERLFFEAAIKWLSGNLAGVARDLEEALQMVPNYESALRLSAAVAEAQRDPTQTHQLLERLQQIAPNDHRAALRGALLSWQRGNQAVAIARLEKLLQNPEMAPLADYWLGRLFLIWSGKSFRKRDIQRASEHLRAATAAGISKAEWYQWLCQAKQEYDPQSGWDSQQARQLLDTLPGSLSEIPIAEVAAVAALVAIETDRSANMLDGCALLLALLRDEQDEKSPDLVSLDNLTEALWRTATTVTSLDDRLVLSKLAHEIGESSDELGRTARRIVDATLMSTIIAMAQSGENIDEALAQVDEAIKMTPNALMPRLARTSLLVKKGEMTTQQAITSLKKESQPGIAQALEECIHLAGDSGAAPACPAGLVAFLTINKANLSRFASILETLSVEAMCQSDEAFLLEMARCTADAGMRDDAMDLYTRAYESSHSKAVAGELSNYLCYVAAQLGPNDVSGTSGDLEKVQQLLSVSYLLCKEHLDEH